MERCIDIHLRLHYVPSTLRPCLIAAFVFMGVGELASENVALTTYYPAPSGVYTQLIATSNAFMARDAGYLDVGTNAVPPTPAGIGGVKEYVQNGAVLIASPNVLAFGNGSEIDADQGGAIELGGNNSVAGVGVPYIDFHYGGAGVQDFNARLINDGNNQLSTYFSNGAGIMNVVGGVMAQAYLPNYASWASIGPGTGSGGAAIYNDANAYRALMVVGNYSAGNGSRQVGIWDKINVAQNIGVQGYAPGGEAYVYVNAANNSCSSMTGNNATCPAGMYITWVAGMYVDNQWWSSGADISITAAPPGQQANITTTAPTYYCCWK